MFHSGHGVIFAELVSPVEPFPGCKFKGQLAWFEFLLGFAHGCWVVCRDIPLGECRCCDCLVDLLCYFLILVVACAEEFCVLVGFLLTDVDQSVLYCFDVE